MNPANFPNVGGAMNGGAKPHGQMQAPPTILASVAQALQAQGPFTGWRAEVTVKERTIKVHQMMSSLRLIQPQFDPRNAAQAAMNFEQKAFREAASKSDYEREFNNKLVHIRDTRARQAAAMQGGMMQQGPVAGMPGVGQSPFPQQMNRPVQASPMPGQQQMQMGMSDPNQQAVMQHRQQQQQSQAMLQQQRGPQRPAGAAALSDELNSLSPQEYENVCRVATQILQKTPPEDMNKIKMNLQNMSPDQKLYLSKKGMDPVTYFFRCQALSQLRRYKRNRMEMARNGQNNGVDPNNPMMGDPMMNPQQRQMLQNMMNMQQRNSPFPVPNQQNLDHSSFIGNVENIQGQQADGLRSQEAGQLVVPASSSQMNQQPFSAPQNIFQAGQQLGQSGQVNMNSAGISPQFLTQQHLSNAQPGPQDAAQFQSSPQAQSQAQRVQAAQKAQMAMSQAGQASSHMQQQISQSPAMPMLNRPMAAPGQMSPAQVAAQVQPQPRQPGMGQQPANVQTMGAQAAMQNRPAIPANLPPHVQEQLAQMSNEQLNTFLMQRRLANNQALARANATQQPMSMQHNLPQSNPGQQMVNGPMGNPQNMRASLGLQQQLAAMAGAQQPNQMIPGQQMSVQQRQQQHQQQQQQLYRLQLLRQHGGAGMEMTPDQIREMDRMPFPPAILNNNPNAASIPKTIKTWGQLKQLAATNLQLLGGMDLQKLMTLQKYHLAQILKESNNRNLEQNGQAHWMSMNFQGQPQSFLSPQQFSSGQPQPQMAMPPMRPITAQDIQLARQRLGPQAQSLTDEQLREGLRQRQIQAHQARAQALANQQNQPSQPQQAPPVSGPPVVSQVKPEPQAQQQVAPQNAQGQAAKSQAPAPVKTTKTSAPKPAPQTSKRKAANEESVVSQPSATQSSTQPQAPQGLPASGPPRPNLPFTREQIAAMTPQQRAQVEAHLRRQQGQARGPINRAAAEEAWNNLPEKIRQLYNDLAKNAPPDQPIAVTPEQRAIMNQQLRDCTDYLGRMDALVQFISKVPIAGQEKNIQNLLGMRIQLMRQFKPGPDWALNDQVTITPEYLSHTTTYIKRLFHSMIARVNQQQNQLPGRRPGVAQGPNAPQANQNTPALNASNLQQLQQQQEEALQRARRASSQTAVSATSVIPPAPFGAPSPQGVPHAYGPGSIPPQELKLPPPKKRKQSHPSTTPASGPPGSKSQTPKQATGEAKPALGAFKCSVPECQNHHQGFATQDELDKHVEENHKVEESIDNALEFALQSFSTLIKNDVKPGAQRGPGSAMDMPSLTSNKAAATSSPAKHEARPEGTTPIPGTTPMGRVPSQFAAKPASPASSQPLTPAPSSAKAPSSLSLKPTPSRDGKKEPRKAADQDSLSMDTRTKDPWADSAVSLEAIRDTFIDLGGDGGLGFGAMDEFLNAEMFTGTQDTPDSVETGIVTQTPKDGDVPKNEDASGKDTRATEGAWIPVDWFNLPGRFEDSFLVNEACEDMDWEMLDLQDGTMNVDDSGIAICAI